ncbi:hypothetical protein [Paenibacillus polymyxa]|uniref:hypothetical protein n=1 Tax=Paenibacillus polymyxa TaxID=1406 RepID=UPI0001E6D1EA|nr:hypothetical protein [Paenibacillus polymyxa]WPQ59479.1 hypothetical protein SKN87_27845 [Paenibacillus polymyxa]
MDDFRRSDSNKDEELCFCPYCGDELPHGANLKMIELYVNEHGICPHWDDSTQIQEF